MGDITNNFSEHELACPCCGIAKYNTGSVHRLQRVRDRYGKRIDIVDGGGYRCVEYGGSNTSAHYDGMGFDLGIPKEDLLLVEKIALDEGFTGKGLKNHNGEYQIHIDDAPPLPTRPRPWSCTYK